MPESSGLRWWRLLFAIVLGLGFAGALLLSYRWPLVWDAQVFHYANFLVDHGYRPYKDITDMNLPGTYLVEGTAMHVFGGSDLAWRMYDFSMLAVICVAAIVIAAPYDWLAGWFAGALFAITHIKDGPTDSAERDEAMAMLLIVSYAFFFGAVRRQKAWLCAPPGFFLGVACAMKPTFAPIVIALLATVWYTLRSRRIRATAYLSYAVGGVLAAAALVLGYLLRHHALGALIEISRAITPFYSHMQKLGFGSMLWLTLIILMKVLLPFGLIAAWKDRAWRNWERFALLLAVLAGLFSYFIQGKGYAHHRYTLTLFLLLWFGIEFCMATRRPERWLRNIGFAGLAIGVLAGVPYYLVKIHRTPVPNFYTTELVADLQRLGGDRLQHRVQCIDLVQGCFQAMYRTGLLPSSGSLGDLLYFSDVPSPVVDRYRNQLQTELAKNPPDVIILANDWHVEEKKTFDKLQQWPAFAAYLRNNFDLNVERTFPAEYDDAYRVYVRKGSGLPVLPPD